MRKKSENEARDRYARRYAAVLAVEAMIQFRARGVRTLITVEAEDNELWDDIVEKNEALKLHRRHQVKRQMTPLTADDFGEYVKEAAKGDAEVAYHFAFTDLVKVKKAGETRVLRGLCERLQQKGADQSRVLGNLQKAERTWIESIKKWAGMKDEETCELLKRIHIDLLGFEEDLDRRALRVLEPIFAQRTEEAWATAVNFVAGKDGVAVIDPKDLLAAMPAPAADEIETFYWSFIEQAETAFCLDHWVWLTDHLVRDLMPLEFCDGVSEFNEAVQSAAWPGRHPELEKAIQNLEARGLAYLSHFTSRSYPTGNWLKEDRRYKSIYPNPRYDEEWEAAQAWVHGNQKRFRNTVVALNEMFASVRKHLNPTFRLRDGKLGIHDEMGVTNEMRPVTYYPEGYADLAAGQRG